ncbi:MAG: DUF4250 domain-containing protein [Oscillospiraceae bacterium]|nr:DUF4250 domain-containing protein [Oscillospiraceae bacterium]
MLPNDPVILLSYVNTKLRDEYDSLSDFCDSMDVKETDLIDKLSLIEYKYDNNINQFI